MSTLIVPVWGNGYYRTDFVDQFLTWSTDNRMMCNPSKCKELIFRKKGVSQDFAPELPILGVMFQENCKYSAHVRAKLIN